MENRKWFVAEWYGSHGLWILIFTGRVTSTTLKRFLTSNWTTPGWVWAPRMSWYSLVLSWEVHRLHNWHLCVCAHSAAAIERLTEDVLWGHLWPILTADLVSLELPQQVRWLTSYMVCGFTLETKGSSSNQNTLFCLQTPQTQAFSYDFTRKLVFRLTLETKGFSCSLFQYSSVYSHPNPSLKIMLLLEQFLVIMDSPKLLTHEQVLA